MRQHWTHRHQEWWDRNGRWAIPLSLVGAALVYVAAIIAGGQP